MQSQSTTVEANESPILSFTEKKLMSPKSTNNSSLVSLKSRSRKPSSSSFVFYIDADLMEEQAKLKEDDIMKWFEEKNIKAGNPEHIMYDHNESQRRKAID